MAGHLVFRRSDCGTRGEPYPVDTSEIWPDLLWVSWFDPYVLPSTAKFRFSMNPAGLLGPLRRLYPARKNKESDL